MASKMPSWKGIKGNFKDTTSQKVVCKKVKERYSNACKKKGTHPLSCILKQLEEKRVNLAGQEIGPEHVKAFTVSLLDVDYVTSLNLRDCRMGDTGAFYVTDLLSRNASIAHLNLSENNIGIDGLRSIARALADNILITKLDISGNNIHEDGALVIAAMLETRTGLLELRAKNNSIGEKGAIPIGKALGENETLELLDLSWNNIRGKGGVSIANGLKSNKCLRTLDVSWNGFAKDGGKAMGEALKENTKLTELDLTNNRIDANGMAVFMVGLKTNETLQRLKLGKNPFNSEVAKYLLKIIETACNSAITHLELTDVSVDEDFIGVLENLSGRNINIAHGKIVRKVPEKPYVPPPVPPRDPLDAMFEFKYEHGYRTLDLLNKLDRDNNMAIDAVEFKLGLMEMNVDIDDEQAEDIIRRLDTNNDGQIDYSELVAGEKDYGSRHRRHMNMNAMGKITSLAQAMLKMKIADKLKELKHTVDVKHELKASETDPDAKTEVVKARNKEKTSDNLKTK